MQNSLLMIFFLSVLSLSESAEQTDWSGGPGVPGPVTDWGNMYDSSSGVNPDGAVLTLTGGILADPIEHSITSDYGWPLRVYAIDMDADGDIDVLTGSQLPNLFSWWENLDGLGTQWLDHTIDTNFTGISSICAADIDDDGDMDAIASGNSGDHVTWWENANGMGTAWGEHVIDNYFNGASSVCIADVNNDGYLDVLGAARYDQANIAWWESVDGSGTSWVKHSIDGDFDGASSVCAVDFDKDGDMDVLGAAFTDYDVTWWENDDGIGQVWVKHAIDPYYEGANSVTSSDLDGDGDLDVIGTAWHSDEVTWWENLDGSGTSWVKHLIRENFDGACSVHTADVNGDGDMDVLAAGYFDDKIVWWDNADGSGLFWTEHVIVEDFDGAVSVFAADFNADGLTDILGSATEADEVLWWEVIDNYAYEGILESSILDAGEVWEWITFLSNSERPSSTSIGFQFRSSTDASYMGVWSDTIFLNETSLSGILEDSTRYIQYRVMLSTTDTLSTPTLEDVAFFYTLQLGIGEGEDFSWLLTPLENPSHGGFTAILSVPESGAVEIDLFDVSGRVIAEVSNEFQRGIHSINFPGVGEGVYFYMIRAENFSDTEKFVVLK